MRPNEKFDVRVATTEEVFGTGSTTYKIPVFQRAYAWTKDEIDDLLRDLFDELDLVSEVPKGVPPHFLGSLVLTEAEVGDSLQVLDGQQRLTTISLLLGLLGMGLERHKVEDHANVSKHLLVGKIGQKKKPILTLQESDHPLYVKVLEHPELDLPKADYRTLLGQAAKRIKEDIASRVKHAQEHGGSPKEAYIRMAQRVLYEVTFVRITTPSESAAFALFETLNHRGLPLNAADLIKNKLLARAGENFQDVVDGWEEAVQTVGAGEIVNFLRYYWIAKFKFVRKSNLFNAAREELQKRSPKQIAELVHDLRTRASEYKHIANPDPEAPDWPAAWPESFAENFLRLNDFKAKSCRPLLIAVADDPNQLRFALEFAETITLRHSVIADGNANTLEREYQAACNLIREGVSVRQALRERLDDTMPSDNEFLAAISKVRLAKVDAACRRILVELNRQVSTGETEVLGPKAVHVEHILPQTPSEDWFADDLISKNKHKDLVGALGNLTLLHARKNARASNKTISEKLRQYQTSEIRLTRMLADELCKSSAPKWGEEEIKRRTSELAQLMIRAWPSPKYD